MADNGVNKKTTQSNAPTKPKVSAPSSMGGTSAPGIVFDYCPTEFSSPDAPEHPISAPAASAPEPASTPAAAPSALAEPRASAPVTPPPAAETAKPKPEPAPKPEQAAPKPAAVQTAAAAPEAPANPPKADPAASETRTAPSPFGSSADFVTATTAGLSVRMLDIAQANFNASFEFAKQVASAKDLAQVLELQRAYLQQQFAAVTAQTEEMADFARKFSAMTVLNDIQTMRFNVG